LYFCTSKASKLSMLWQANPACAGLEELKERQRSPTID
jgi:hypothetical protein